MLLPTNFKTAIADRFYDKSFVINRKTRSKDAEGGVVIVTSPVGTFNGNVQNGSSGESLKILEQGLVDRVDLTVTTAVSTDVNTDDELVYGGKKYTVKGDYTFDSHLLLVCETA